MTACPSRKRGLPSREAADATLGRIWSRCWRGGRRLESRYYQCPDCGLWHLTSKPDRPERTDPA
jgi:hypothetical protein